MVGRSTQDSHIHTKGVIWNKNCTMYDTINFYYERFSTDDWQATAKAIEDAKTMADVDTGELTTSGHSRNLRIKQSESGLYICGSLAKWFLPDEPLTLNRRQAQDAIAALSDTLHVDMSRARVQRIDGSKDFLMAHEPQRYYDLLAARPRYSRVQSTSNTLYFNQNIAKPIQRLCFYDKRREVEHRKADLPQVYEGSNLLRYELRLTGRIRQQMKWDEVTGATLYDRKFYHTFVDMWATSYFSIEKRRAIEIGNIPDGLNTADVVKVVLAYGLQHMTPEDEERILMAMKDRVKDRHYIPRAKAKLRDIRQTAKISDTNALILELDAHIRNVQIYGR